MARSSSVALAAAFLLGAPLVIVATRSGDRSPAGADVRSGSHAPTRLVSAASPAGTHPTRLVIRHRDRRVLAGAWVGAPYRTRALRDMAAAGPRRGPVVVRPERPIDGPAGSERATIPAKGATRQRRAALPVLGAGGGSRPRVLLAFDGIDLDHAASGGFPADPTIDVSPTQVVEMVNTAIQVFGRDGGAITPAISFATFFQTSPKTACATDAGDPIVLWDEGASRWLVTQFTAPDSGANQLCVASSVTADAAGPWSIHVFDNPNAGDFADYPKWGIGADGYYLGAIDFSANDAAPMVGVLDRQAILGGQATVAFKFLSRGDPRLHSQLYLPADVEGAATPPAPGDVFAGMLATDRGDAVDGVEIVRLDPNWANPAADPVASVSTVATKATPTVLCDGVDNCISQKGFDPAAKEGLDPLSDRLLYRASYRRVALPDGSTRDALALAQTVNPAGRGVAATRWIEIADPFGVPALGQEGTYAPAAPKGQVRERWMGSVSINAFGAIAVGYSLSGSDTFPSSAVAGRTVGDRPGNLGPETVVGRGTGIAFSSFQGSSPPGDYANRWGDYSQMVTDPDGCTFWYANMVSPGREAWRTRIAHVGVGPCTPYSAPVSAARPALTGSPRVGRTLTCSTGTWDAQPPVRSYAASKVWRRGTTRVGSGANHRVSRRDVGRGLRCTVTVANLLGKATATSRTARARR